MPRGVRAEKGLRHPSFSEGLAAVAIEIFIMVTGETRPPLLG